MRYVKKRVRENVIFYFTNIHLVIIIVLYFKEWFTILDGELCHHCACPEYHTMLGDIVLVDLTEDTPIL
jgi:hypothetical protein